MAEPSLIREFEIKNVYGIHARPAAMFVKTASRFGADVQVEKKGLKVSGKSIMGLLTLEGHCGSVIRVTTRGVDAEAAMKAIAELIERRFDEDLTSL